MPEIVKVGKHDTCKSQSFIRFQSLSDIIVKKIPKELEALSLVLYITSEETTKGSSSKSTLIRG